MIKSFPKRERIEFGSRIVFAPGDPIRAFIHMRGQEEGASLTGRAKLEPALFPVAGRPLQEFPAFELEDGISWASFGPRAEPGFLIDWDAETFASYQGVVLRCLLLASDGTDEWVASDFMLIVQ
jgi:hypothetical protein